MATGTDVRAATSLEIERVAMRPGGGFLAAFENEEACGFAASTIHSIPAKKWVSWCDQQPPSRGPVRWGRRCDHHVRVAAALRGRQDLAGWSPHEALLAGRLGAAPRRT